MAAENQQSYASVAPETLAAFRLIARAEGHDFETALEDAMLEYVAAWRGSAAIQVCGPR